MYRKTWLTPSERRCRLSKPPTPCGSNDPPSNMSEARRDTERPPIRAVEHEGRWVLAEENGDSGAWITAETTLRLEDAR
jgi:hypothetical protein